MSDRDMGKSGKDRFEAASQIDSGPLRIDVMMGVRVREWRHSYRARITPSSKAFAGKHFITLFELSLLINYSLHMRQ